jgi:hypothetical protein
MKIVAAAAIAALALMAPLAACGSPPHKTAAAPSSSTASSPTPDPGQSCLAQGGEWTGAICITPTPSPSDTLNGPPGTTFTVTADDGTSYDVTLDKVMQHVRLGQYDSLNNYQDHAAAAEFTITGDAGSSSDDAFSDANAIGSDQTEYQSSFITDNLPQFSSGDFQVAPGQTEKGWVTFELPPGVTLDQVQWAAGGIGSQAATWTVGS